MAPTRCPKKPAFPRESLLTRAAWEVLSRGWMFPRSAHSSLRLALLLALAAQSACSVYGPSLLDPNEDTSASAAATSAGGDLTAGASSGGTTNGAGGASTSAGSATGGGGNNGSSGGMAGVGESGASGALG